MPDDLTVPTVLTVVAWACGALLAGWASGVLVRWLEARTDNRLLGLLHRRCYRPWVLLLLMCALYTAMPAGTPVAAAIRHGLLLALIAAAAWLLVRLVYVVEDVAFQALSGPRRAPRMAPEGRCGGRSRPRTISTIGRSGR